MRIFVSIVLAALLSACAMEEMASKLLPDDIEQTSWDVVTATFAEDVDYFLPMKPEDMSLEDFEKQVLGALSQRSGGDVLSKHLVSASTNTNVSAGSGRTRTIEAGHEIETSEGFTLVSTRFTQGPNETVCCRLANINVQKFDTSPAYQTILLTEEIMKISAVVIPLVILFVVLLVLRSRRKKRVEA